MEEPNQIKTIWKFELSGSNLAVEVPMGSKLLTVQEQNGGPSVWFLVDTALPKTIRTFKIYETGETIKNAELLMYINTYQLCKGALVYHVFEQIK